MEGGGKQDGWREGGRGLGERERGREGGTGLGERESKAMNDG